MATQGFFYLVDKDALQILYSGELPESWGNIPSVNELSYETLSDLTWAGFPNLGFLTEEDARAVREIDQALVDQHKKAQYDTIWEQIKAKRDTCKYGGVELTIDGVNYWFWTDEPTRTQYALLVNSAERNQLPADYVLDDWKTMAGVYVPMTVARLHQVIDAGIAKEKIIFNFAKSLYAKLYASNDPASLDWKTGWAQTYEDYAKSLADVKM